MIANNSQFNSNLLFTIQITLAQYPILQDRISEAMFKHLVQDGFTTFVEFEKRVRDFALMSQRREGLNNPFAQEGPNTWEIRLQRVRSQLINVEFSQHYSLEIFSGIVNDIIQNKVDEKQPLFMWHNLEFASIDTIFDQALAIERMSAEEKQKYEAKLVGAKVVLIRKLLSDQLPYVDIAKNFFSIQDLIEISKHRIGKGSIGGKAAGMLLARQILQNAEDDEIRSSASAKESFYIGSEELYSFLSINDKLDLVDMHYGREEDFWTRYDEIRESIKTMTFPKEIVESLERVVLDFQGKPFIVRSSSLLEDGFNYSLSGLYDSRIIANQGSVAEAVEALLNAVKEIYCGVFDPRVLTYRLRNGLIDYPESMAILIQVITGNKLGNYLFPDISGVGSSRTPFTWQGNSKSNVADEGYLRLVCGLGTRAIRRGDYDFPQIVVLNEPDKIRSVFSIDDPEFSQQQIDVINLKSNQFETLDIQDVINEKYKLFSWVVRVYQDGVLQPVIRGVDADRYVINFNELIHESNFAKLMRDILHTLEKAYKRPVLAEFTIIINLHDPSTPAFQIQVDKCRPVITADIMSRQYFFDEIRQDQKFLETDLYVQNGLIKEIDYIVWIDAYEIAKFAGFDAEKVAITIRNLNKALAGEKFILASEDRFGTADASNGIPVHYGDISNTLAITEISDSGIGRISDPLIGSQFFHNLAEGGIYVISINLQRPESFFNRNFIDSQPNEVKNWLDLEGIEKAIKVLPTKGYHNFAKLNIAFDQKAGKITAYFS